LLTTAELNSMRATAAEALPGTAVIQTFAQVSDGGGGYTETWTAAGTVDCRMAPIGGSEREMADRISADAEFVFTLPTTASVTTNSRLIHDGGTFNVEAIRDRSYEVTQRVEAVKAT
jgi:SPP1 family predicted phage head-tail adaptor